MGCDGVEKGVHVDEEDDDEDGGGGGGGCGGADADSGSGLWKAEYILLKSDSNVGCGTVG